MFFGSTFHSDSHAVLHTVTVNPCYPVSRTIHEATNLCCRNGSVLLSKHNNLYSGTVSQDFVAHFLIIPGLNFTVLTILHIFLSGCQKCLDTVPLSRPPSSLSLSLVPWYLLIFAIYSGHSSADIRWQAARYLVPIWPPHTLNMTYFRSRLYTLIILSFLL